MVSGKIDEGEKGFFWEILEGKRKSPPARDLLGWKLIDFDREKGYIKVQYEATKTFLNPVGNVQGGILAAMLDNTLGSVCAIKLAPGQFSATLELKTSFVNSAKPGPLFGEGYIVRWGKSVCFAEGELKDAAGMLIAKASGTAPSRAVAAWYRRLAARPTIRRFNNLWPPPPKKKIALHPVASNNFVQFNLP